MLFIATALLLSNIDKARGQDIQFSQFYAASMYLNPAFTGNTEQFRLAGTYRKQWPKLPGTWTSQSIAYDQSIPKINSGMGLLLVRDKAGTAGLRFTSVGLTYAYKFAITRNIFSSFGVRVSHTTRAVSSDQLVFWDQIVRGDPFFSVENLSNTEVKYADFSAGYTAYSKSAWVGLALDHLTTPNQSFIGLTSKLPMKFSLHGGYKLSLAKTAKGSVVKSVSLVANYKAQQKWDQLDIGAYVNLNGLIGGLWYRGLPGLKSFQAGYGNSDALVFLIGYSQKDVISIGYSYDLTISKLTKASGGAHEITLIYEYAQPEYKRGKGKKNVIIPCMKF